jgi:uncharacterized membrane protein
MRPVRHQMQCPEHRARQKGNIVRGFRRSRVIQDSSRGIVVLASSVSGRAWVTPEAYSTTALFST